MTDYDYWERVAERRIRLRHSGGANREIVWDEDDPELLFADLIRDSAGRAGAVLDIGCGEGRLARELARSTGLVVGLDVSSVALREALAGGAEVEYVRADALALPFVDGVFDLVSSRRGPVSGSCDALREISRVLAPGGQLVALMIGEAHRIETQEIFGRGINWPPVQPARFAAPERLAGVGLEMIYFAECYATTHYPDIEAFADHLETIPTIPRFDRDKDAALLREVSRKLTTDRGIRDTEHMAVFVARKPDV